VKVKNFEKRSEVEVLRTDLADYLNTAIRSESYSAQKVRRFDFNSLLEGKYPKGESLSRQFFSNHDHDAPHY
jgi:hypothetical protein